MRIENMLAREYFMSEYRKYGSKSKLIKCNRDSYIPEENSIYEIYGRKMDTPKKGSSIILDAINFGYSDLFESGDLIEYENSFTIGNVEYLKKDISPVSAKYGVEIKAENNKIQLVSGKYYRFSDSEGESHALTCVHGGISQPYIELLAKKANKKVYRYCEFWNLLSWNGTYLGLYYSDEEQRKWLNDAGIKEGFFSVQIDSNRQEYFYSNGVAGIAVPKSRYDGTYNMFMRGEGLLDEWDAGAVFIIGGEEYILGEDKKLDIPYGADIYDIKYPPRKSRDSLENS